MAKKRIVDETPEENEPVEYDNVEPEAVEDTYTFDAPPADGLAIVGNFDPGELVTKPGGEAVALTPEDERQYRVTFSVPYGVLVALLDVTHDDADWGRAIELGLIDNGVITKIGALVLGGFDKTAVGHKMAAAWRAAQNAKIDSDKRNIAE